MKSLHCADLGFKCDAVVKAETEESLLEKVAEHAKQVHHLDVTPEIAQQAREKIREES